MNFKVLILIAILLLAYLTCYPQHYKKFRVGVGFGQTESTKSTILLLEPSFRFNDKITIGLRMEGMGEKRIRECYSLTLNTQSYVNKQTLLGEDFRFFIGIGAGAYFGLHDSPPMSIQLANGQYVEGYVDGETSAARGGFYPRIGIDYKHFSICIDYNLVYRKFLKSIYFDPVLNQTLPTMHTYRSDNYISFKVAYFLGGGKKRE